MVSTTIKERLNRYDFTSLFKNVPLFIRENFSIFFVILIGFIGWITNLYDYTMLFLGFYFAIILMFNFNIRNVIPAFFIISSCIGSPYHYFPYVVGLCLTFLGFAFYIIRHCVINKEKVEKGNLFWGFVALTICYSFGGLIGHLNIKYNLLVFGLCVAGYAVYFLVINFCINFKTYFRNMIIWIAILLTVQFVVCHVQADQGFFSSFTNKWISHLGLQNINNVAIYFTLAMVAFFHIAYQNKKDYLYCLLAMFFAIMTFLTYCRMGTAIAFFVAIICLFFIYKKSSNKKIFNISFIILGIFIAIIIVGGIVLKGINILSLYSSLYTFFSNGREITFPWAMDQFLKNPIFGIGYYIEEGLPIAVNIHKVTVDNTILQYLLSTGLFGLAFAGVFCYFKYKILFNDYNYFKLFNFLSIFVIALNGITSQASTTDVFLVELNILFIALAEIDTKENNTSLQFKQNFNKV